MLATLDRLKENLDIPLEDDSEDDQLTFILQVASTGIESYCCRKFQEDYNLPGDEDPDPEKDDLPFDIQGAAVMWAANQYRNGDSMGLSSERIDGLGQKNYALPHINGKMIPAPPHVLALIDPYRWLNV